MPTRSNIASVIGLIVFFCMLGTYINLNGQQLTIAVEENYTSEKLYGIDTRLSSKKMSKVGYDENTLSEEQEKSKDKGNCQPDYFKNALLFGRHRNRKGYLTIGIPSMKRPANQTYLFTTLDSLLNNSNAREQNETVIVIFLSDMEPDKRYTQAKQISARYKKQINSGLIQVIEAPKKFYPSFDNLTITYGHPIEKVKWRSKQNIDYAFMMKYSQNISEYYLQLEDDVVTVPRYRDKIKDYMDFFVTWTCLEYSSIGFIGKLFHSYDLNQLADMLILFFNEQPNDVTYLKFNYMHTQFIRYILQPTIFQHIGNHSTLPSKKLIRTDPYFKDIRHTIQPEAEDQTKTRKNESESQRKNDFIDNSHLYHNSTQTNQETAKLRI